MSCCRKFLPEVRTPVCLAHVVLNQSISQLELMIMRTYALYGGSRAILIVLLCLGGCALAVGAVGAVLVFHFQTPLRHMLL